MVGAVAAAALQFPHHSDGRESHSALGRPLADSAVSLVSSPGMPLDREKEVWAHQGSMLSPRSS